MLKKIMLLSASTLMILSFTACDTLQNVVNTAMNTSGSPLTNDQVAGGLKDALKQGFSKGADVLATRGAFGDNQLIKKLWHN
jgi:hypothetical protein